MRIFGKLRFLIDNVYYNSIAAFFITIILGLIDWYSGFELSFQFFYFIPLALISYNEQRTRFFIIVGAVFVAFIWLTADYLSGHIYSSIVIMYWNAMSRFIVFVFFSIFLNTIIKNRGHLRASNKELNNKTRIINESIDSAKRIQISLIPDFVNIKDFFPDSFILSLPKNVLSGDFFWSHKQNNKIIMALVDCTGHGIPGAFLSVVGVVLLNKIVVERKIDKPDEILNEVNAELLHLFNEENQMMDDGMEISIIAYDLDKKELQIAQTTESILIINAENEIMDIQSDVLSNTKGLLDNDVMNKEFKCKIEIDSFLYMFTDGITDQFGGEKNKKFGRQRLKDKINQIHQMSADVQFELLNKDIDDWKGTMQQTDDITIVGIRIRA